MQNNKIKRVRSAAIFRCSQYSSSKIATQTSNKNNYIQIPRKKYITNPKQKDVIESQNKEKYFKDTIKILAFGESRKSLFRQSTFKEYSSQSWRTIHSARSMSRLQSLKRYKEKDPIKLNLEEKVQRIQRKHSQKLNLYQQIKRRKIENPQAKQKVKQKQIKISISNRINQILKKWETQKSHQVEVYQKKVGKLSTLGGLLAKTQSTRKLQLIKWEID